MSHTIRPGRPTKSGMNPSWLLAILAFSCLPSSLLAQDARSMGIGGAATAVPMNLFGIFWNPASLAVPDGAKSGWTVGSGFSAFDSSNIGSPILQFNSQNAMQSSQDPVNRGQQYLWLTGVKNMNVGGGVLYDQQLSYTASQGALAFFNDRANGTLGLNPYNLNFQQTNQQIADLILSYGTILPLGTTPFFSVGGSLKYHDGLQYQQISLTGTYTQGVTTAGYQYTKTTSNSGLGLSIDLGFLLRLTDALQFGMMFQNIQSSFSWQAQQQSFNLDPNTGAETPAGAASNVTVQEPFPYATKLAVTATPSKDINLDGEVDWTQQQTHWSGGLERFYAQSNFVIRLGTFYDDISQSQLWTIGLGYLKNNLNIDIALETRSLPEIENSIALGGALDVLVHF
jgi:hypothetical protein